MVTLMSVMVMMMMIRSAVSYADTSVVAVADDSTRFGCGQSSDDEDDICVLMVMVPVAIASLL